MPTLIEEIDEAISWVQHEYGFVTDVLKKCKKKLSEPNKTLEWLKEQRELALEELRDNADKDPNSYGAGYDLGHADAFGEALEFIQDPNQC